MKMAGIIAVVLALGGMGAAWAVPERVVVAGIPLYSEILISLGLVQRIVGVASSPENPPEVAHLPTVGTVWEPSVEAILALAPDLVLGPSPLLKAKLMALNVPVLVVGDPEMWITSIAEVLEAVEVVGRAMGVEGEAQILAGRIAREILSVEARVLGGERPTAAVLYLYDPVGAPYVAGRGTPEHELIARAGGVNAFRDVLGYVQVSVEAVLARDPALVFVGTGQGVHLRRHVVLAALSSVQKGQVHEISASQAVSTRVAEVLKAMAQALHPQAFGEKRE